MVLIVSVIGPSAFGIVFVWFAYSFVRFSYGFSRFPRRSIGFLDFVSYGRPIVLLDFRIVLIVPLVGRSALG